MRHASRSRLRSALLPWLLFGACAAPSVRDARPASTQEALGLPPEVVLPAWAEALAPSLPTTTFQLLALEHRQRAAHPLGRAVSALVRQAIARHLACPSMLRTAERDLAAVPASARDAAGESIAVAFAAAMAAAPQSIPDDVFRATEARFGAAGVVALVHSVAYANFQARLQHGLGVADAPAGPCPPSLDGITPPQTPAPERAVAASPSTSLAPARWESIAADELQSLRVRQQQATPRLPPPSDELLARASERERSQAARIVWSRFGYGYQPELTRGWITSLYAFYAEAKVDPVVENSLFWVVTRSNDCFY